MGVREATVSQQLYAFGLNSRYYGLSLHKPGGASETRRSSTSCLDWLTFPIVSDASCWGNDHNGLGMHQWGRCDEMTPRAGCDVAPLGWERKSTSKRFEQLLNSCESREKLPALFACVTRQPLRKPSGEKMSSPSRWWCTFISFEWILITNITHIYIFTLTISSGATWQFWSWKKWFHEAISPGGSLTFTHHFSHWVSKQGF